MSRLDVVKSLLRSSARSTLGGLRSLPLGAAIERLAGQAALGRLRVPDARLTSAVARLPGVLEATVSSTQGCIRVDLAFDDGEHLAVGLLPAGIQFAPGGAKELSFALQPPNIASSRVGEVAAAIAAELARTVLRPLLSRAPRAEWTPHAMRDGERVVFDLRSVPEVRWVLSRSWGRAALDVLRIRAIDAGDGGVTLSLGLEGLGRP
jgi:hypothetical protein